MGHTAYFSMVNTSKTTIELAIIFLTRVVFPVWRIEKYAKLIPPISILEYAWLVGQRTLDQHLANWCSWTDEQSDLSNLAMGQQRQHWSNEWLLSGVPLNAFSNMFECWKVSIVVPKAKFNLSWHSNMWSWCLNYHFNSGQIVIICICFPSTRTCSR